MSVSGRAGLFTMDDGRFFGDLRGTPYTASKRQKSGALRLEFGQFTMGNGNANSGYVATTVNVGICATVSPAKVPVQTVETGTSGGLFLVATPGNYISGRLSIYGYSAGSYSGQVSGLVVNYMVVGY